MQRGKRKKAIARAVVKEGKGNFRINKSNIETITNTYLKEIMYEPLKIVPDIASKVDISVSVKGGGPVGQAQAVRSSVARAIYEYTGDESIKNMFIERDRFMFVEDSRRIEPKKCMGPKARARKQKSYR
ncbi:30S ribosomal protein S9 [Candidatus Micrarchaeota archaeon]|nr:30S ribosomal protein S9 [Candidatus Micrarchaeota archaeon]